MKKPRDLAGNDFIVACAWVACALFRDKYKRESNPKYTRDDKKIRLLSEELYSVVMRHWKKWDE